MNIFKLIKNKIKQIAARIAGLPKPPTFATIYIYKNGLELTRIENTMPDITEDVCQLIGYFSKYSDYKIIYDYSTRGIKIYFSVKKAQDVEPESGEQK